VLKFSASIWQRPEAKKLGLVWQSIWGSWLGYSIHSEALAYQLHLQGVYLMHRQINHPFAGAARNPTLREIDCRPVIDGVTQISYAQADHFYTAHPGYKIGFTMLEVDGIPKSWVRQCNLMDEIFVPTTFNLVTFIESGVRRPIKVIPLGIDRQIFNNHVKGYKIGRRFTFLSVFEWGERKAGEILLKAYNQEFTANDDVLLLIKSDNRDPSVNVKKIIENLRLENNKAPIVFLPNFKIPDKQMSVLYHSANCFVLPTRGEGFGVPILEAMACGLPVIATAWSGPKDFLDEKYSYPLNVAKLIPAVAKCPYYEGFKWAEPDIDHLRYLMRYVYEHPEEALEKGNLAAKQVASRWTWSKTAAKIKKRLKEIECQDTASDT
jgi:glycosyltransferase involved in cell wall biosynthesis